HLLETFEYFVHNDLSCPCLQSSDNNEQSRFSHCLSADKL
ncbi:unnamed protein product, partial [Rotaria sp. Silwood2]